MAGCSSPKKFYNFLGCFFLRSLSLPFCLPTLSRSLSSKRFCDYTFIGLGKESGADLGGCRTKQTRSVLAVRDCPLSAYAEQRRCRYTCPKAFCFSVLYNRLQNKRFCVIISSNMPQRRQNSGGFFMGDDPLPLPFPVGLLVSIIVLILTSGFFSAMETAYSCASRIKLRTLVGNGNKRAKKVLDLAENKFDKLISILLVGNNIVNLTASTLSVLFFQRVMNGGANYSLVSTIVITLAVLTFGEIIPKYIAKVYPEKLALTFYPLVMFFYYLLFLGQVFFGGLKWLISKIFRLKPDDKITEDDLMTVVEEAEEDGTIREEETRLIRSVIEFDDLEVCDILVPRVNVISVELDASPEEIKNVFLTEGYSRVPVYKNTIDTIVGTIHEKDFFNAYLAGKKNIRDILRPVFYTTEHVKISELLKQLQKKKTHIAIVLDEYGGTLGLVTLEDILEELVGEIWDEYDEEVNYFKKLTDDAVLVDGNAPLSDAFEYFGLKGEEENFEASTLSGWLIEYLGEIPPAGKKTEYQNVEFEITKSSVKRILQVKAKIKPLKEDEKEEEK